MDIGGKRLADIDESLEPFWGKIESNPLVKRAAQSYADQVQRCYNPNNPSYRFYGGKGVRVRYVIREFIAWWLSEKKRLGLRKPTIGRIDHNGHYEFGNVCLQSHEENCTSVLRKMKGRPWIEKKRTKVDILDAITGRVICTVRSQLDAERVTGTSRWNLSSHLKKGNRTTRRGLTFRYSK